MKTRAKLILKSLADLPANACDQILAAPQRAASATRQLVVPPVQATRRQLREARRRSVVFMEDIYRRAQAPFRLVITLRPGGLGH